MANLDITKLKKRENIKTLAEKIFHINGKSCTFHTKDGRFDCQGYELKYPGESIEYETRAGSSSSNKKRAAILIDNLSAAPSGTKLWIIGKYGKSKLQLVKINEITKTDEFGGQPGSGGKKVNKGNQFEEDLQKRLEECIGGKICKGQYGTQVKALLDKIEESYKLAAHFSKLEGGKNQPRPLTGTTKSSLHIAPNKSQDHGKKLTDITLQLGKDGKKDIYLSLKFGGTLTFMNAGVGKVLTQADIKKYDISAPQGSALLQLFGIDETKFCHVFNGKSKKISEHIDKKPKADMSNIKRFLKTAIGSGYWMIHGHDNGKITMWEMTTQKTNAAANSISKPVVYYGGKTGTGKRIDVEFTNEYFDFKLNIRNKQSGIYPSHVMLDYKSKSALQKIEL